MCQCEEDVYITLDERLEDAYQRVGGLGKIVPPDDAALELFK